MSVEKDIIQLLENPLHIEDPEMSELMEKAETHYIAYLKEEDEEIKEYEKEMVYKTLEQYEKVQGLVKDGGMYDF